MLIFVLDGSFFPGKYKADGATRIGWSAEERDMAEPDLKLSKREIEFILYWRLVYSGTYSMQQDDFARSGFRVENRWNSTIEAPSSSVVLPDNSTVVGLGTADRYNIFFPTPGLEIVGFDTVDQWREDGRFRFCERDRRGQIDVHYSI